MSVVLFLYAERFENSGNKKLESLRSSCYTAHYSFLK